MQQGLNLPWLPITTIPQIYSVAVVGLEPTRVSPMGFKPIMFTKFHHTRINTGLPRGNRTPVRRVEAYCIFHYTNGRLNLADQVGFEPTVQF